MRNIMQDTDFLKLLSEQKVSGTLARVTILNWNEKPLASLEGDIISGSMNYNGNSSMRRTGNLTILLKEDLGSVTDVNSLVSINKKMKVEIGVTNSTGFYEEEEIIWFNLGYYLASNPSISHNNGGVTLSVSLKDKMSLLNGDFGGRLASSVILTEKETVDSNGDTIIVKPTIYEIIKEAVNHLGKEKLHNIIISDVPLRVKQVMKWNSVSPLFVEEVTQGVSKQLTPSLDEKQFENPKKYSYGDDVGYTYTDFTSPKELIGNIGGTVTEILDSIISILSNFEYFYDVEGRFIFQEKKNYLNTTQAKVEIDNMGNENYLVDFTKGKSVYDFTDSSIISSYSNTPRTDMIKNDFVVWGMKENASGITLPIRYHLAIDSKPSVGNTYKTYIYTDEDTIEKSKSALEFASLGDFPNAGVVGIFYYASDTDTCYTWDVKTKTYKNTKLKLTEVTTKDWRTELYLSGSAAEVVGAEVNDYYIELKNEWGKIYDVENSTFKKEDDLDFYLDFIDTSSALGDLSVENIGRRSVVESNNDINCIFKPEIPDIILLNNSDPDLDDLRSEAIAAGQTYMQMSNSMYSALATGGNPNSAFDRVRELLYNHTSYNESITLNTLPVYSLEPNTLVTVKDSRSGISGEYFINTISFPLASSGSMSIAATRKLERI